MRRGRSTGNRTVGERAWALLSMVASMFATALLGLVILASPAAAQQDQPDVDIEALTNFINADSPVEAPYIEVGSAVTWTYEIVNTGTTALVDLIVTDSQLPSSEMSCDGGANVIAGPIAPGELVVCEATGVAFGGLYVNWASVSAQPVDNNGTPIGSPVTHADPSHYFGAEPGIDIETGTNGEDADVADFPAQVVAGESVTWVYEVTNTGNTDLVNMTVFDDQGVTVSCDAGGSSVILALSPGATAVCVATDIAFAGLYANLGSVVGQPVTPNGDFIGMPVASEDPSHYLGEPLVPDGSISGLVWFDADDNGAFDPDDFGIFGVEVGLANSDGDEVFTYTDNFGNYEFAGLPLGDYTVRVSPITLPADLVQTYDDDFPLDNESTTTLTEAAPDDIYQDFVYRLLAMPSIDIEVFTNGIDGDAPDAAVTFLLGDDVYWDYVVVNTGNVELVDLAVNDADGAVVVDCYQGAGNTVPSLAPGEVVTCTAAGTATVELYSSVGFVIGFTTDGVAVYDDDPTRYLGVPPFSNELGLVTLAGRSDAWLQFGETRNWVSPLCRSRLVAAGVQLTEVPWPTLAVLVDAVPFERCDELFARYFGDEVRIMTLTGRVDGWVDVNGTRNWVSNVCRAQLVAAGAVVREVSWPTLASYADAVPFQRCDGLLADLFPDEVKIVTLAGRSDGWLNVGATRNWVSADCRTQLEAAGAVTREVAWPILAVFTDAVPFQRCPALLESLFNQQ